MSKEKKEFIDRNRDESHKKRRKIVPPASTLNDGNEVVCAPIEILTAIFLAVSVFVEEESDGMAHRHTQVTKRTTLLSLAQTCARWRHIAFSLPNAWRHHQFRIECKYQRDQVRKAITGVKAFPAFEKTAIFLCGHIWIGCTNPVIHFIKKYHHAFPSVKKVRWYFFWYALTLYTKISVHRVSTALWENPHLVLNVLETTFPNVTAFHLKTERIYRSEMTKIPKRCTDLTLDGEITDYHYAFTGSVYTSPHLLLLIPTTKDYDSVRFHTIAPIDRVVCTATPEYIPMVCLLLVISLTDDIRMPCTLDH